MRQNRIFSKIFFIMFTIFVIFNFLIWNIYTKYIFDVEYTIGDLGRMSYSNKELFPREDKITLTKKHIDIKDYKGEDIDVITIGDSFSNGHAGGMNSYYQDYITTIHNLKVLNIPNILNYDYIETITFLNNIGFLKNKNVKYVIIESVQRESLNRFIKEVNFNSYVKDFDIDKEFKKMENIKRHNIANVNIINNLNFNAFLYNILYNFDDNAIESQCYKVDLRMDFFSSKNPNKLLFFKDDLERMKLENENNIRKMNNNFNILSNRLSLNGINLFFMPAVDKYNLYSSFIIKNEYPKSIFFEELRKLEKDYTLIDTKEILIRELENNNKDIYYSDDTHWSYKASEIIVKNIKFKD